MVLPVGDIHISDKGFYLIQNLLKMHPIAFKFNSHVSFLELSTERIVLRL